MTSSAATRTGDGTTADAPDAWGSAAEATVREIGQRIRRLRKERGMTLQGLAQLTGVSTSMLSMVERGQATPSIGTLVAVATTLGLPMSGLFVTPEAETRSPVTRRADQVSVQDEGGVTRRIAHDDRVRGLEMVVNTYDPGAESSSVPTHHVGWEYGVVVRGSLVVDLDGVEHRLDRGDAISYASMTPHRIINPGRSVAIAVWLNATGTGAGR